MTTELISNNLPETDFLVSEFDLDNWWKELLGKDNLKAGTELDLEKARKALPELADTAANIIKTKINSSMNYSRERKHWNVWDGKVYKPVEGDVVARQIIGIFGMQVSKAIEHISTQVEAVAKSIEQSGGDKADEKAAAYKAGFGIKFKEHKAYRDGVRDDYGMSKTLNKLRDFSTVSDEFFLDNTSWLVVENGVIDLDRLRAGELFIHDHSPLRPVANIFNAQYMSDSECPKWDEFLRESIIDRESVVFFQKCVGAAFLGANTPRVFVNLQGARSSGKSMIIKILTKLGGRYTATPNNAAIIKTSQDTNFYHDQLFDKRFVGFSEVSSDKSLDNDFVKSHSGGDKQSTRTLHGQPHDWYPHSIMFVASNNPLKYDIRDEAMVERMSPVMFPYSFVDMPMTDSQKQIDRDLEEYILKYERNGVLKWIVAGMVGYLQTGLPRPKSVIEARERTKRDNSYAVQFMEMMKENGYIDIIVDEAFPTTQLVSIKDMYNLFKSWAGPNGMNVKNIPGKINFGKDIAEHFYGKNREYLTHVQYTKKYHQEAMDMMHFTTLMFSLESSNYDR